VVANTIIGLATGSDGWLLPGSIDEITGVPTWNDSGRLVEIHLRPHDLRRYAATYARTLAITWVESNLTGLFSNLNKIGWFITN
jgi:hypothetical protein